MTETAEDKTIADLAAAGKGETLLLMAAYERIRELEDKVRNIDGMTPGERGRRKTKLIVEQRRRIHELEGQLRFAQAGWDASQHALKHARGEPCAECGGVQL